MTDPFFFGYGSLVNRATHGYTYTFRASAGGWRRAWRRTSLRPVSFLTALPCPGAEIEGLVAAVPGGDWAALDTRERAYERVTLTKVVHDVGRPLDTAIYAIPEGGHNAPGPENPILLSYLDVVFQGYRREFGEDGVVRFVETTDGWEAPVLDDRAAPRYPRAQPLGSEETAFVDGWLRRLGASVVQS